MSLDMQLLIIQCPGHGQQRRGGHVPNGRSFCIPSNEGPVDQFGPGAKALNARFESKLFVNFVNACQICCHFEFCGRPTVLSQSCLSFCELLFNSKLFVSFVNAHSIQLKSKLSWALRTGTRSTTGSGGTSVARISSSSRRSTNTPV